MGTLTNLNGITEPQIPAAIARDAEVAAAIAAHTAAADPHPVYLTQTEGNERYRDYATQIFNTTTKSVGLSFGSIVSNSNESGIESRAATTASAAYMIFHRPGIFAIHFGIDTDNKLKVGGWSMGQVSHEIIHDGNIASKTVTRLDDNATVVKQKLVTGTTPTTPGNAISTNLNINPNNILGFTCMVGVDQGGGHILWLVPPGFPSPGYAFTASILAGALNVRPGSTDSANMLNRPFKALITYLN